MKIAFDAKRLFNNHTGLGNYSRTLVTNLSIYEKIDQYILFAPNTTDSQYLSKFQHLDIVDPRPNISAYWRSFGIHKDLNKLNLDIYHGLSNELPFSSSKIKAKKIVTIHDLFYEKYPQDFSLIDRNIYKLKTEFACKKADHIIAISEATKRDIIEFTGTPDKKITVLYQSCNPYFSTYFPDEIEDDFLTNLPEKFFLYVGTLNKRKNLISILRAMKSLHFSERIPLVVVGTGSKKYTKYLRSFVLANKLETCVFFLGSLVNNKLKKLYKKADFLCLPSSYEGFGIPIIEALSCGTPVLSSRTSAMPEAVGPCGMLVDPTDNMELANSLQKMAFDESMTKRFRSNIPNHVSKFDGKVTAQKLRLLYNNISV